MRFQRKLWSIDMPEGWTYQEDGQSVAFFNPDGVGSFHVSAYQKDEAVTDSDLCEFGNNVRLTAVNKAMRLDLPANCFKARSFG
jgi:hypothetical protein